MSAFESPQIDHVYHITSSANLASIDENGLLHDGYNRDSESRGDVIRHDVDLLVDANRTDAVRRLGISRGTAIFAHPDISAVELIIPMGNPRTNRKEDFRVALELDVDPTESLVCDASLVNEIFDTLFFDKDYVAGSLNLDPYFDIFARKYWEDSVTLDVFRRSYRLVTERSGYDFFQPINVNDSELPDRIDVPEILVPRTVSSEQIRWAASGIRHILA